MNTWLQGDDRSPSADRIARFTESGDLSMRGTGATVEALGEHLTSHVEQHTPNPRVRSQRNPGGLREGQRTDHGAQLCLGASHLITTQLVRSSRGTKGVGNRLPGTTTITAC